MFDAVAPMTAKTALRSRLPARCGVRLARGAVVVAGWYGAIDVYIGESLPRLSDAGIGDPETGLRKSGRYSP